MISFHLFGIPVRIHPWHWVTLALLGGIAQLSSPDQLADTLMFMAAGFIAVLCHEMAHALTGIKLGYRHAEIDLIAFGGVTQHYGTRVTPLKTAIMTAAGPLANIIIGLIITCAFIALMQNAGNGIATVIYCIFAPSYGAHTLQAAWPMTSYNFCLLLAFLVYTSFWWSLLNLLPIMPLDGGQIMDQFVKKKKITYIISIITACAVALIAWILTHSIFLPILLGFLAYQNYKAAQQTSF